jgi:hypothetical protein
VQLYIDGRFVASRVADLSRPDVKAAGRALDEWHGFSFETPPLDPGEHVARVYVVHESGEGVRRTLQLLGDPKRFRVEKETALLHVYASVRRQPHCFETQKGKGLPPDG